MLTILTALTSAMALLSCSGGEPETPAPPAAPRLPDKVLIIVDTLRADAMQYAGNPLATTPNLNTLAAEGAWFSKAYSASTWTLPGTASIFTGKLPSIHRAVHDADDRSLFGQLAEDNVTLAESLKDQGYRTAAFINNAFMAPAFGLDQGFDTYDYQGADLIDHRTAQQTVNAALAWLNASSEPAFLVVHVMEPHADYQLAEPFAGTFTAELPHTLNLPLGGEIVDGMIQNDFIPEPEDRAYIKAAYLEEVLATDDAMGSLLSALRARPGWSDSTVVVTSDHGEEFWEHGTYEHGHRCNSVVTQVPLIVKAPGVKPHRNDSVVSLVDLYPMFTARGGDILRLASAGVSEPDRIAVSEDTLYAEPQASVVTDDLRLVVSLDTSQFWFHTVDSSGVESEKPSTEINLVPKAKALRKLLCAARGDLKPTPALDSIAVPGPEVFSQLRELGYVEDEPEQQQKSPTPTPVKAPEPTPDIDPCASY